MKKNGIFITFEGGDGAGKTTLIQKIFTYLETCDFDALQTRAPGGTERGQDIRNLLLHQQQGAPLSKRTELLLFLADRAQHVDELILPELQKGKIVLCDRFNDSTIAYQSGARGFKENLVRKLCDFAADCLVPDLTLYLDLDPKIGLARAQKAGPVKDRIESETLKFHQKIRKSFQRIAKKEPKRFITIDASETPEEVYSQAKVNIDAFLQAYRK
jgi:dTMP kinase